MSAKRCGPTYRHLQSVSVSLHQASPTRELQYSRDNALCKQFLGLGSVNTGLYQNTVKTTFMVSSMIDMSLENPLVIF